MNKTILATAVLLLATIGGAPGCSTTSVPDSASTGFDVTKDGFSFENYGGSSSYSSFGVAEMVRMFGASAVCVDNRMPCNPKPGAVAWARSVDEAMNAGRCEGFAVLSQLFFSGGAKVSDFGASTPFELSIAANEKLGGELAYWFGSQMAGSVLAGKVKKFQARDVMEFLAEILKPGAPEAYRLGILNKQNGRVRGGHALTPIGYRKVTDGVYELRVYDNNVPGEERFLTIDTEANRWSYVGSLDPSEPGSLYFGDDKNRNPLYFAPVKARLGEFACKFCNKGATQTVVNSTGSFEVTDAAGNKVAFENGEVSSSGSGSIEPAFGFALSGAALMSASFDSDTVSASATGGDTTLTFAGANQSASFRVREREGADAPSELDADGRPLITAVPAFAKLDPNGAAFTASSSSRGSVNFVKSVTNADGTARTVTVTIEPPQGASINASISETGQVVAEVKGGQEGEVTVQVELKDGEQASSASFSAPSGPSQAGTTKVEAAVPQDPSQPITAESTDGNGTKKPLADLCADGIKNGTETDIDCGGTCGACTNGAACSIATDCSSGFCAGKVCEQLPTGGTITTAGGFRIHTFPAGAGAFESFSALPIEYLIVAGGGGGGSGDGGGGGGGGVLQGNVLLPAGLHALDVGLGGVGAGLGEVGTPSGQGGNSTFNGLVAIGGGRGGQEGSTSFGAHPLNLGGLGGSGGGGGGGNSSALVSGGVGTAGQGFDGGARLASSSAMGGGGGAGGFGLDGAFVGNIGGDGGPGLSSAISGVASFYGGGGGGSGRGANGNGGSGGGGNAGTVIGLPGVDGTGGGGGGGGDQASTGGQGGRGVIIIRYPQ